MVRFMPLLPGFGSLSSILSKLPKCVIPALVALIHGSAGIALKWEIAHGQTWIAATSAVTTIWGVGSENLTVITSIDAIKQQLHFSKMGVELVAVGFPFLCGFFCNFRRHDVQFLA